jgi:hypothetical protein
MAEIQSQFGKLEAWNDFLAPQGDLTWGTGVVELGGGVATTTTFVFSQVSLRLLRAQ